MRIPVAKRWTVLALVGALWPTLVLGQERPAVGVVASLTGHATVSRPAIPAPAPLKFKDDVFLKDTISTGEKSLARLLLGGKAVVTVRELSDFIITEEPGQPTVIGLKKGTIGLAVARSRMKPGEAVEVRTPNAVAAVRGTVLVVEVGPAPVAQLGGGAGVLATTVSVLQGMVQVSLPGGAGSAANVGALERVNVTGNILGQINAIPPMVAAQLQGLVKAPAPHTETPSQTQSQVSQSQQAKATALAELLTGEGGESKPGVKQQKEKKGKNAPANEKRHAQNSGEKDGKGGEGQTQTAQASGDASGGGTASNGGSTTDAGLTDASSSLSHKGTSGSTGPPVSGQSGSTASQTQNTITSVNNPETTPKINKVLETQSSPAAGPLEIPPNQTINANQTFTTLSLVEPGMLAGTGTVTITGATTWTGGRMSGSGTTLANGSLEINDGGPKTLARQLMIAAPAAVWRGTDGIAVQDSGLLSITSGGVLDIQTDAPFGTTRGVGLFSNQGVVTKSGEAGTTEIRTVFNNSGMVEVDQGTLKLAGGGTHSGQFTVASPAALVFGGGTHAVTGTISGAGTVKISGGTATLDGGTYHITGSTSVNEGGSLVFNPGVTVASVGTFRVGDGSPGTATFDRGAGSTTTIATALTNGSQGAVKVTSGTLKLTGDGTHSGQLTVASGATFEVADGSHDFSDARVSGGGALRVSEGTVTVNSGGTGTYSFTGTLTVSGGSLSGSGDLFEVGAGESLSPSGTLLEVSGTGSLTRTTTTADLVSLAAGGSLTLGGALLVKSGTGVVDLGASLLRITGGSLTTADGVALVDLTGGTLKLKKPLLDLAAPAPVTVNGPVLVSSASTVEVEDNRLFLVPVSRTFNAFGGDTSAFLSFTGGQVTARDEAVKVDDNGKMTLTRQLVSATGTTVNLGQEFFDVNPGATVDASGGPSGTALIELNGGTINTGKGISNPFIEVGSQSGEALGSTARVKLAGGLLKTTGMSLDVQGALVHVHGGEITTSVTETEGSPAALVSLTGGSHSLATTATVGVFDFEGRESTAAYKDIPVGGESAVRLSLGTDRPIRGIGNCATDCTLKATLFEASGAQIGTSNPSNSFLRMDTALLEATKPLLTMLAGSELKAQDALVNLVGKANLTADLHGEALVNLLGGSAMTINSGALFNVAGGSFLNVTGSLVKLDGGSRLTVSNGALVSLSGGSVFTLTGYFASFGNTGTNSIALPTSLTGFNVDTGIIPGGYGVALRNGATAGNVTVGSGFTPFQNLVGSNTVTTGGILLQLDGAGNRAVLNP